MRVFKNYILVTDVFHSVQMLFFREEDNSIHLVAKDFNKRVCRDVDMIIDQQRTAMVSTDDVGNLQIFLHQPK
ncbi:hypothetical protein EON65_14750 [archaeon]|nr:MAG: hypothetical protein EON65_14750 [archaeon]